MTVPPRHCRSSAPSGPLVLRRDPGSFLGPAAAGTPSACPRPSAYRKEPDRGARAPPPLARGGARGRWAWAREGRGLRVGPGQPPSRLRAGAVGVGTRGAGPARLDRHRPSRWTPGGSRWRGSSRGRGRRGSRGAGRWPPLCRRVPGAGAGGRRGSGTWGRRGAPASLQWALASFCRESPRSLLLCF